MASLFIKAIRHNLLRLQQQVSPCLHHTFDFLFEDNTLKGSAESAINFVVIEWMEKLIPFALKFSKRSPRQYLKHSKPHIRFLLFLFFHQEKQSELDFLLFQVKELLPILHQSGPHNGRSGL